MADRLDRALTEFAEAHHGVFSTRDLDDLGITARTRKNRLEAARWVVVYDGVYRIAGAPRTWRGDLMAARCAGGADAAASHRSSAELHEVPGRSRSMIEITCPRWHRAQHDGVVVHESRALSPRDMTIIDGITTTTIERTIFDLCAVVGPVTVELAIDNAIRRDLTTIPALEAMLRRVGRRGLKGTRLLRALLHDRSDSWTPTESEQELMLLTTLRRHGLPEPVTQYTVRDDEGRFVARVDLAYPDLKIALEYDSYQEHVGNRPHVRDNRRRSALTSLGWAVLVATAEDVGRERGSAFAADVRRTRTARVPPSSTGVRSAG